MRRCSVPVLVILALLPAAVPSRAGSYPIVESRTIERTLDVAGGMVPTVVVDDIFGSIEVVGHDGSTVELVAEETVRARSRAAFDRAREEVRLDVSQEGDEIAFVVDGPFRDCEWRRNCNHSWDGFSVTYDIRLRVPRDAHLELKTVNDGEVRVDDVHGRFHVSNVNGGIRMAGVTGPGEATTVNGPVRVRFDRNPDDDSSFKTVNGEIELWLQPQLSADLSFKTFNGEAFTDFPVTPLATAPPTEERNRGRRVIRADAWNSVRVDRGGPQLTFETLNGDILIHNSGS